MLDLQKVQQIRGLFGLGLRGLKLVTCKVTFNL